MKVAIAKRVDLNARIEHEERKLSEVQDPAYSDDQRDMIESRIKRLRGELTERNKEMTFEKVKPLNKLIKSKNQSQSSLIKKRVHLVRE